MTMPTQRLTGCESFGGEDFQVLEFWQWAHSDLLSNTLRGILAEFIVAKALGTADGLRQEWDAFDVTAESGERVEVKSAAYLQSWHQKKLSNISFDIAPKKSWDAKTNSVDSNASRSSDLYVFALLHEQNREVIDPTALDQWTFFALSTKKLNELGDQKTITLGRLKQMNPVEVAFSELADGVQRCLQQDQPI